MIDRLSLFSLMAGVVLLSGCPRGELAQPQAAEKAPRASVALRVLVVNEPGISEAINRLRGEWAERSGGQVSVTASEWKDVAAAKSLDADVVIFPSRYLGELSTRGWLQPVRSSVLEGDEFKADDVFPLLRRELMRWGSEAMALPLATQLVLADNSNSDHPGLRLLALAAPNAVSNAREGVLFDPQTMKPRISDPVFVDALLQLGQANVAGTGRESGAKVSVPVLGFADPLIAVSSGSRNGASAFKLIAWLASPDVSPQLVADNKLLQSARRSAASPSSGATIPAGEQVEGRRATDLSAADQCLLVPRIPGVDKYIAALDEDVKTPPVDQAAAEAALKKVADEWEEITDAHGREAQRQAYLKHLQISE